MVKTTKKVTKLLERRPFFTENDFKLVSSESEYFRKEIALIILENPLKDLITI